MFIIFHINFVVDNALGTNEYLTNSVCTNNQRLEHLRRMCQTEYQPIQVRGTRLIVDDNRKLMMCEISKSGCTTWKALWLHSNMNPGKNLSRVHMKYRGEPVHNSVIGSEFNIRLILTNGVPDRYLNHTKFMVIRNPFDRLVSAYYNLINWKPDLGDAGPHIIAAIKNRYHHLNESVKLLTFAEFVEFVMDSNNPVYNDRHWIPYSKTCDPCRVKYDYVIRLETMKGYKENDALPVLKLLGYDTSILKQHNLIRMNSESRHKDNTPLYSNTKPLELYEALPITLIQKIFQRYVLDLKLFGYNFNVSSHTARCELKPENNSSCC